MEIRIGIMVRIKKGATAWMKSNGYWIDDMINETSIDDELANVVNDHTDLKGNNSHWGLKFDNSPLIIGVHPQWIEPIF